MPKFTLSGPEADIGSAKISLSLDGNQYVLGTSNPDPTWAYAQSYEADFIEAPTKAARTQPAHTWYERLIEEDGVPAKAMVKVVRDTPYNDLMANEVAKLAALYPKGTPSEKFHRYLPQVLDHGQLPSGRLVTTFAPMDGFVSLESIIQTYPEGIDFRDMVWMFKRLLVAIGFAHECKIVHGSIVPLNFLVHPIDHGGKLCDWGAAVQREQPLKTVHGHYTPYYPEEVWDKDPAGPETDIYMAAKCAVKLLGGNEDTNALPEAVPVEIQDFLKQCLGHKKRTRPSDAWLLHERFDALLQKLVGKPVYRPFSMAAASASS